MKITVDAGPGARMKILLLMALRTHKENGATPLVWIFSVRDCLKLYLPASDSGSVRMRTDAWQVAQRTVWKCDLF